MKRICLYSVAIISLAAVIFCQPVWAAVVYVKDSQEAPLRSGPSTRNRIIAQLPPDSAVEILKKDEWTRVRFSNPEGKVKEGWIESKHLVESNELERENEALKEQFAAIEKEKAELSQKEKLLTDKLTRLEAEYATLKNGSQNYLKIKDEYDSARVALTAAEEKARALTGENQALRLSQKTTWVAVGAMALLCGWFIGWIMGRYKRKRRSPYHM